MVVFATSLHPTTPRFPVVFRSVLFLRSQSAFLKTTANLNLSWEIVNRFFFPPPNNVNWNLFSIFKTNSKQQKNWGLKSIRSANVVSVPVTFFLYFLLFWHCFCNLFLSYLFILRYYWCCSYWNTKFPEGLIKFLSTYLWKYISVMQEMTVMKRSPGEKCWKFECRRRP